MQHQRPHLLRQCLNQLAPHTRNRSLDLVLRHARQQRRNPALRLVEEHTVRDRDADRDPRDLPTGDEAHGAGDVGGLDAALRDGERRLAEGAYAQPDDDRVPVHHGRRGAEVHGEHERGPDDEEHPAAEVPGHVEPVLGERGAVDDAGKDHHADVRQDAHAGRECAVALRELEEEGNPACVRRLW